MIYKSVGDLSTTIARGIVKLPRDIELVIGVPRSGMLAASIVALQLNCHLCDINAFVCNAELATGRTRRAGLPLQRAWDARKVLVMDDSAASGEALTIARQLIAGCGYGGEVLYAVAYLSQNCPMQPDFWFEVTQLPRLFEWNLFHRKEAMRYCVDIDGVLCMDPTADENDDGPNYLKFLTSTLPLARPSHPIGHLVTSRLEKYRVQTEEWLAYYGVEYGMLHMLNLPNAEERRRLKVHGQFKASVYSQCHDADLFVESESEQAETIARASGKPVLDFGRQTLIQPPLYTKVPATLNKKSRRFLDRVRNRLLTLVNAR